MTSLFFGNRSTQQSSFYTKENETLPGFSSKQNIHTTEKPFQTSNTARPFGVNGFMNKKNVQQDHMSPFKVNRKRTIAKPGAASIISKPNVSIRASVRKQSIERVEDYGIGHVDDYVLPFLDPILENAHISERVLNLVASDGFNDLLPDVDVSSIDDSFDLSGSSDSLLSPDDVCLDDDSELSFSSEEALYADNFPHMDFSFLEDSDDDLGF